MCWVGPFLPFCIMHIKNIKDINPIIPSLFLNSISPGGGKFAPPYKTPNNGREVPKLIWNLISYRD